MHCFAGQSRSVTLVVAYLMKGERAVCQQQNVKARAQALSFVAQRSR